MGRRRDRFIAIRPSHSATLSSSPPECQSSSEPASNSPQHQDFPTCGEPGRLFLDSLSGWIGGGEEWRGRGWRNKSRTCAQWMMQSRARHSVPRAALSEIWQIMPVEDGSVVVIMEPSVHPTCWTLRPFPQLSLVFSSPTTHALTQLIFSVLQHLPSSTSHLTPSFPIPDPLHKVVFLLYCLPAGGKCCVSECICTMY